MEVFSIGKRKYILLNIISLLLVTAVFSFLYVSVHQEKSADYNVELSFSVLSDDTKETIHCWKDSDGFFYVFLPGYADMGTVYAMPGSATAYIGETQLTDGMPCNTFSMSTAYPFVYTFDDAVVESTITFVPSGNLPSLYIDVESSSMEYIHMNKTHEESGRMRLYSGDGIRLSENKLLSIKGRGNTSWAAEKKPYNLTLTEESDLLGMGSAKNWILLAEGNNAINIRNKLVYDFADRVGLNYSPDCEWVDLYLNGEYAGLYLLTERNEIHKERIDIPENGSFVISMENQTNMENQKIPYVMLDSSQVLRIRYSAVTDQEIAEIWGAFKNSLLSENGRDPNTGKSWNDMIDMDSWVRKYLIEEVFANPDGGAVSQYFYMNGADPQKKIFAGPVWDYDYALGGEDFWLKYYDAFLVMAREYTDDGMYLPWFYELYQKDEFYSRLTEIYEKEFLPQLKILTETTLDRCVSLITASAAMDGIRWGHSEKTIQEDISLLRTFLENRISFLSDLWIEDAQYHIVQVNTGRYLTGYFAVKDGESIPALPSAEELGGLDWYQSGTEQPFDMTQPIYEDIHIYVKKPESGLPAIHYVPAAAIVLILPAVWLADRYRTRKNRRYRYDSAQVN